MDEFERQLLIMDLEQEAEEYELSYAAEIARNPIWWNIAHGLQDAPRAQYDKAKEITAQFLRFRPPGVSCFFERVRMFEQANLLNQMPKERRR
jgi:hypothetical protein